MKNTRKKFIICFVFFSVLFIVSALCLLLISKYTFEKRKIKEVANEEKDMPTVIIDAGHGGEDGGAIGVNGAFEKEINLSIAKKIYTYLTEQNIKCIMTRDTDILLYDRNQDYRGKKKLLDMEARKKIAESYDNAIFISIHQNSFTQSKYNGFQAYYSQNDPRSFELVTLIERCVKSELQTNNRRASKASNGNIYLLDRLYCPAVLLECGFLSNAEECALLCSDEYQNKLSIIISCAIIEFLKKA